MKKIRVPDISELTLREKIGQTALMESPILMSMENPEEYLKKKDELTALLSDAIYNNDVLTYAIDALCEAYDKINSIYSPILSEKAANALKAFTNGKYEKLFLDKNFEIRLQSESETKELGYFEVDLLNIRVLYLFQFCSGQCFRARHKTTCSHLSDH